jgi:phosphatidylglycerophosphate synthase
VLIVIGSFFLLLLTLKNTKGVLLLVDCTMTATITTANWNFLLAEGPTRHKWFDGYSYSGDDRAILKAVRQPVCLWLVSFVPMHWASHALTIVGSLCLLPALVIMMYCAPNGRDTEELAWVSVMCGVGAILWDVLDNMDGPQARRTKTAGILGDFLDHMLDYISLATVVYGFLWSTGLGTDGVGIVLSAAALAAHECACFMTWWGRRFTKHVVLGAISQDEAVLILAASMFFSATVSPAYWQDHMLTLGGVLLTRAQCVCLAILVALGGGGLFLSGRETLTHRAFPASRRIEALFELWPLLGFLASLASAILWLARAHSAPPSMAVVFLAVSAVCWPLSDLQLLAALACRPPSRLVNVVLLLCPLLMAYAHLCLPTYGLLATAIALHGVNIAASRHVAGVLMERVQCQSLWVIPPPPPSSRNKKDE